MQQRKTHCMHTCPTKATPPTHLHGLLPVLGGCAEAVEGEVLHNHVDPLLYTHTSPRGPTPYKVTSTGLDRCKMYTINNQNWWWIVAAVGLPWGHICAHTCACVRTYTSVVWLARPSLKQMSEGTSGEGCCICFRDSLNTS